jgi:RNA polymerase-binding transcription factor DksA
MHQLNDEQCATLLDLLAEHERLLTSAIDEHVAQRRASGTAETSMPPGDIADQADNELNRERDNTAVTRDAHALEEIAAARERIAAGVAGICINCGGEIGFERLLVQPTAARCVPCQEFYERSHRSATDVPG